MALVTKTAPDHWTVHLGSPSRSTVTVEVHMAPADAARLVAAEEARLADAPTQTPREAVLPALEWSISNS